MEKQPPSAPAMTAVLLFTLLSIACINSVLSADVPLVKYAQHSTANVTTAKIFAPHQERFLALDKGQCALLCQQTTECLSVSVYNPTNRCRLNTISPAATLASDWTSDIGWATLYPSA